MIKLFTYLLNDIRQCKTLDTKTNNKDQFQCIANGYKNSNHVTNINILEVTVHWGDLLRRNLYVVNSSGKIKNEVIVFQLKDQANPPGNVIILSDDALL